MVNQGHIIMDAIVSEGVVSLLGNSNNGLFHVRSKFEGIRSGAQAQTLKMQTHTMALLRRAPKSYQRKLTLLLIAYIYYVVILCLVWAPENRG